MHHCLGMNILGNSKLSNQLYLACIYTIGYVLHIHMAFDHTWSSGHPVLFIIFRGLNQKAASLTFWPTVPTACEHITFYLKKYF